MLLRSIKTERVCDEFLENLERIGKKTSTIANYHQKIHKHLKGNLPSRINKIKKPDCDKLIDTLKMTLSNKSVNDIIILLNSILAFSYEKHYISKLIKIDKIENTSIDDIEIFTDEEQNKLMNYILSHLDYFNFSVLLVLTTGLRIGEISALKIDNFFDDFIIIKYTLQRVKNINNNQNSNKTVIIIDNAKSRSSIRKIPLPDVVINTRKQLKYRQGDYITTGTFNYIEPRTIEKKYKTLLEKCDIKYRKFHTLRHTFSMNCVKKNMPIKMLSELLGHSSTDVTEKYYIHFDFESKKKILNR